MTVKDNRQNKVLAILLVVALVHGSIYIFLVPPWQHYDEPNHFEYAWLVANRLSLPEESDSDPQLSRQVTKSMVRHKFYPQVGRNAGLPPGWQGRIEGYSQLDEPPLYYLLVAIPLRLAGHANIETQLYMGRLVSLALFLLTVWAAWGVMQEMTSGDNPLRWMVPLSVALLPSLADILTAVNNDAGAIAIFSMFLWGAARLMRRGFSWLAFIFTILIALASFFVKSTALFALALYPVVLLFTFLRGKRRRLAWGSVAVAGLALIFLGFAWGDAANWARSTDQTESTRDANALTPAGGQAIQLQVGRADATGNRVYISQLLPRQYSQDLEGKPVTLGVWMWADKPMTARSPALLTYPGMQAEFVDVMLGESPSFFAFTSTLSTETGRVWITLAPPDPQPATPATVFYSGLVLAESARPLDQTPSFSNPDGSKGIWGSDPFDNLLRNPLAEHGAPRLRSWVDRIGSKLLPDKGNNRPSVILYSLLDWKATGDYYKYAAQVLGRSFWAKFGWGHVSLLGHKPYRLLALVTLVGLVGAVFAGWRLRKELPWDILFLFGLSLFGVWGAALTRGANYLFGPWPVYFAVSRYVYPAVIPALYLLNLGWAELFYALRRWLRLPLRVSFVIYIALFFAIDIISIMSIYKYYG